ncbi:uncharacterized protein LOC143149090 [Ptiloglossa arizonensis]|uniref:uncharacterized protein LOC143149090 n=1 Tax=Ptiloglossa arizonensis TaxID=3350558 RepID=UPI003F9F0CA9
MKYVKLRVKGLNDLVTWEQVVLALVCVGDYMEGHIKVEEIRMKKALSAVHRVVQARGHMVGWVVAKIEILVQRPLQCYRYLETGYFRQRILPRWTVAVFVIAALLRATAQASVQRVPSARYMRDLGRPAVHRIEGKNYAPPS